jgi:hypothetical protein
MTSTTFQIIYGAIQNKQQIIATYDGHVREMCPHAVGFKRGIEQALFYQFAGGSSKGPITQDTKNNWRCLALSKLSNISVRDGEWHTFSNHSEASTCIDDIRLEVTY